MLPSLATLCCRNGATMSLMGAKLSRLSAVTKRAACRYGAPPSPAVRLFLTPGGVHVRRISLSDSAWRQDAEFASPSDEDFGTLSAEISGRRSFRKVSPEMLDLSYQQDDDDQKPEETSRRPGRRNTTYWYFLQCKKLIKAGKVSVIYNLVPRKLIMPRRN